MDIQSIPPSEIKALVWWEYEEYVARLNAKIERENKQNQEAQKNQQGSNAPNYANKIPNMSSMMNNLGKYKP